MAFDAAWLSGGSSILSAIAGFVSGILSFSATKQTNEQNQANYEDWKAYNSPANQMSRLKQAGLNPYMVNGMSNTLSAPFNVQNNTGIADAFQSLSQAAGSAANNFQTVEQNRISNERLKLDKLGLDIRERLAKSAIKQGDARAALLWAQGSIADLNANFWADVAPYRLDRYKADTRMAIDNADFLGQFNPLRLGYYMQFYPETIANIQARTAYTKASTSQLFWNRMFQQQMFDRNVADRFLDRMSRESIAANNIALGYDKLALDEMLGTGRLGLQQDYYDLAKKKWFADVFFRGLDAVGSRRQRAFNNLLSLPLNFK